MKAILVFFVIDIKLTVFLAKTLNHNMNFSKIAMCLLAVYTNPEIKIFSHQIFYILRTYFLCFAIVFHYLTGCLLSLRILLILTWIIAMLICLPSRCTSK